MWQTFFATLFTLSLTLASAQVCFARNLIESYQIESQVYKLCTTAENLMAANQFAQARDALVKAASYDPTSYSANVHKDLYRCYKGLKQYDKALSEAKKIQAIDATYDLALYDMASTYYDLEKYDKAIETMNQYLAVCKDPDNRQLAANFIRRAGSYGYMHKGRIALEAKHYSEAKKWLRKAASYDPSDYSDAVHANLSFVLRELGESAEAVEEGKRALAIDPHDAQTVYNVAMAYEDMMRFDEALTWMKRYGSMETDPARRQEAMQCLSTIEDDRKQFNNPNNKQPDYVDTMRDSPDDITRWAQNRLPLKIAIASGAHVKGYRPSFNNLVKAAFDSWCQASGKRIDYRIVADKSQADITVVWTEDPLETTPEHPTLQVTGLTHVNGQSDGTFSDAVIQVRTVDPFHPDEDVEEGECAHVILHEIGHALGLGHSKFIKDIMYFRAAPQQGPLSARDKATIARVYAGYAVIGFVPKQSPVAPTAPVAPPAFLPPAPPDDSKIVPPMFVPPPLPESDKLTPPVYTPPPPKEEVQVSAPIFLAPPSAAAKGVPPKSKDSPKTIPGKANTPAANKSDKVVMPIFTPPPEK